MEKLSAVSFMLTFTILILGVRCDNDVKCKSLFQSCNTDSDCCSQNCHRTFYLFNKRCISPITVSESVKHIFSPKIDYVICERIKPKKNLTRREPIIYYASYDKLPIETKVHVTYNDIELTVQINEHPQSSSKGERFYLSDIAAQKLGIEEGAIVPCKIAVPVLENNHILRNLLFVLPVPFVVYGIYLYIIYNP